jgi:hypothetical protein
MRRAHEPRGEQRQQLTLVEANVWSRFPLYFPQRCGGQAADRARER